MPKLQFGEEEYRIVGDNGEEGELAEYGAAATLDTIMGRLVAIVDKEGQDVVSLLPGDEWMVRGDGVGCEQEDVQFDAGEDAAVTVDDGDEDEEDGEEDDDNLVGDDPDEDGDDDLEGEEEEEEETEELKA